MCDQVEFDVLLVTVQALDRAWCYGCAIELVAKLTLCRGGGHKPVGIMIGKVDM